MTVKYCTLCNRNVDAKRKIGIVTIFLCLATAFWWIFAIPFYSKRCPICKSKLLRPPQMGNAVQSNDNDRVLSFEQKKSSGSVVDELYKLNQLREKGILTEQEFNLQKEKILR